MSADGATVDIGRAARSFMRINTAGDGQRASSLSMARTHRIGLSRAAFVIGVGRASEDSDSPMLSNTGEVYAHKLPDTKAAAPFNDRKGSADTLRRSACRT